ncbi:MAG TPA: ribonuclease HI family protein [Candidatus Pacearchaeota archaeon]|nr:ribonuclease HI family protein [Candidatus Pacearchaeota archaeon]
MDKLIVHIDGGARGNPGPAALGVVVADAQGKVLGEYAQALGVKTNNEAEYSAAIFALEKIKARWGKQKIKEISIEVYSDSQLLVEQINGRYKIVNSKLVPLFLKLWNLKTEFGEVVFNQVSREENEEADRLVNQALDQENQRLC